MDLATLYIFFPLHIALDMACHPGRLDEGLAVEESDRWWGVIHFSFPLAPSGKDGVRQNLAQCLEVTQVLQSQRWRAAPPLAFSVGLRWTTGPLSQ